jgi:hypothetical protein
MAMGETAMSAGTPIVTFRLPSDVAEEVEAIIRRSVTRRKAEPWTRTAFILSAIREKLDKLERSRKSSRKRKVPEVAAVGSV